MPEQPLIERAERYRQWHRCLASWLVVLLAIAPVTQRPGALGPIAGRVAVQPATGVGHAGPPLDELQTAEPAGLAILSRFSLADPGFGPTPAKSIVRAIATGALAPAPAPVRAPKEAARGGVDRSSVGTARTPTGPPF
jgi:hypothetical protein